MRKYYFISCLSAFFLLSGCTSVITAPIDVASSVVGAGFHMVGAAGGAVVNTVTGGKTYSEDSD
ncbi:hypothetical protein [Nitratifractor sp.]|uniref:hypothetical protein n=1 Tax=Nitratifractor sp. TaxID=2268144 RepID=UPI0025F48426|nr:hypothetical protein [Nitratifractor sp.]